MYTLRAVNEYGDNLTLTDCDVCEVIHIYGLNPPGASIITSKIAGSDGEVFNSSSVEMRNIVIELSLKTPIEKNRQIINRLFRSKRWVRLFYKNDTHDVYIDGYVETHENDFFTKKQKPQISILCPSTYFKNIEDSVIEFSNTQPNFEFPFSISSEGVEFGIISKLTTAVIDAGDIETGCTIKFQALSDNISNPVFYNRTTQQYFKVNINMTDGDIVKITTTKKNKTVTLLRGSEERNIIDLMAEGSEWIVFSPYENEVSYSADSGATNLLVTVTVTKLVEGV
ncbi:MAG: phage tail family protein [Clostridia bacterium]|nr:phage tail family protein [Clostridia bacterium]